MRMPQNLIFYQTHARVGDYASFENKIVHVVGIDPTKLSVRLTRPGDEFLFCEVPVNCWTIVQVQAEAVVRVGYAIAPHVPPQLAHQAQMYTSFGPHPEIALSTARVSEAFCPSDLCITDKEVLVASGKFPWIAKFSLPGLDAVGFLSTPVPFTKLECTKDFCCLFGLQVGRPRLWKIGIEGHAIMHFDVPHTRQNEALAALTVYDDYRVVICTADSPGLVYELTLNLELPADKLKANESCHFAPRATKAIYAVPGPPRYDGIRKIQYFGMCAEDWPLELNPLHSLRQQEKDPIISSCFTSERLVMASRSQVLSCDRHVSLATACAWNFTDQESALIQGVAALPDSISVLCLLANGQLLDVTAKIAFSL